MSNVIVTGFALFAMFFGAGNLIFPPMLGRAAGPEYVFSIVGFIAAGVGLPLMGILAVARKNGGIEDISRPLGGFVSKAITIVIMLTLGPLLTTPRTCATTYEIAIAPNFPWANSWAFSVIYFGIVLAFVLNPLSVVDRVGKILTPALFLSVLLLIFKGIIKPLAAHTVASDPDPFVNSFNQGYQTMDMLAATIFGIILLKDMMGKGIVDKRSQMITIIKAGLIAAAGLGIIYGGLIYLGSTSSLIVGTIRHTDLLYAIAKDLFGATGKVVLGVATFLACLTTAIGLIAVCGEYFDKLTGGRFKYKTACIVFSAISVIFANAGVEVIIKVAAPLLMTIYPTVIVMVVLAIIGKMANVRLIWIAAVSGAFVAGLVDSFYLAGIERQFCDHILGHIPLGRLGLGWIMPALILGLAAAAVHFVGRSLTCPSKSGR